MRNDRPEAKNNSPGGSPKPKRPYVKPAFQHEKVFETMALACGKLGPTQAQCRFNRRNS
ncbi:MAG: hypothetical protein JO119_16660 [Acidobacteria bacterium]|nr:hypothetical protein [Acidobacteriota bacterium]